MPALNASSTRVRKLPSSKRQGRDLGAMFGVRHLPARACGCSLLAPEPHAASGSSFLRRPFISSSQDQPLPWQLPRPSPNSALITPPRRCPVACATLWLVTSLTRPSFSATRHERKLARRRPLLLQHKSTAHVQACWILTRKHAAVTPTPDSIFQSCSRIIVAIVIVVITMSPPEPAPAILFILLSFFHLVHLLHPCLQV